MEKGFSWCADLEPSLFSLFRLLSLLRPLSHPSPFSLPPSETLHRPFFLTARTHAHAHMNPRTQSNPKTRGSSNNATCCTASGGGPQGAGEHRVQPPDEAPHSGRRPRDRLGHHRDIRPRQSAGRTGEAPPPTLLVLLLQTSTFKSR